MLSHMIAFTYSSRLAKIKDDYSSRLKVLRDKKKVTGIVNTNGIPTKLEVNQYWIGQVAYNDKLIEARANGLLYIGVIATHSDKTFLIRVPPPKEERAPKETIEQALGKS